MHVGFWTEAAAVFGGWRGRQPLGPKRSTRMTPGGTPSPVSSWLADSAKPGEPQT